MELESGDEADDALGDECSVSLRARPFFPWGFEDE
jgi:hypothetical protein